MRDETPHILLVEDDDIDAEAIERLFQKQNAAYPIHRVSDGVEALRCLRGEQGWDRLPRPYLILLDLNLPKLNGIEFLEEIRKDRELRDAIVFVLTTSDSGRDNAAAYAKNVAGYLVKSRIGDASIGLVTMLEHYRRLIEFPRERSNE